ncbi:MAG: ribosomal RNA small subunit methyltransferase A [Acidobacteria bacterium]|nr:ribosomal RNA small subunit methyltransferase A [Acidobacteriota bacterium]
MVHSTGSRPKKSLGQNFLIDAIFIDRIVAAVDASSADLICEIGPGRGALTERLVRTGAEIVAVELDRKLIDPLTDRFKAQPNFHLIEQDALTVDFPKLFADRNFSIARLASVKLVANLPFYISTAILQRLSAQREFFSTLVLMFQKEVVDRITADPGNSERGFLTVIVESAFQIERLFDVPPNAFQPSPKVWSSVVRLIPKPVAAGEDDLRSLLSAGFAQKRKTISNNLKTAFPKYAEALALAAIDPKLRAERLTLEDWIRLSDAIRSVS